MASVIDHGIKQLRLDEVLAAAGSSKSQMYHYFSDRDALIDAAVAHRCEEFLGQARRGVRQGLVSGRVGRDCSTASPPTTP